eukprot:13349256-Ditylum_brightwellii.AAC.1
MQSPNYKKWDSKSEAADQLQKKFDLYDRTEGKAGFNPSESKPSQIKAKIWDTSSYLQQYNPQYFPKNFKRIANSWRLNKNLERGRKSK